MELTPAIKSPKDTPSSPRFLTEKLVSAGVHRLPGLSTVEKPSMKMMAMVRTVDKIPRADVYDIHDSGINMVGMMLGTQSTT